MNTKNMFGFVALVLAAAFILSVMGPAFVDAADGKCCEKCPCPAGECKCAEGSACGTACCAAAGKSCPAGACPLSKVGCAR